MSLCESKVLIDFEIPNKFAALVIEGKYSHIKRAKRLLESLPPQDLNTLAAIVVMMTFAL